MSEQFKPMTTPDPHWDEDVKAMERGLQFFAELKKERAPQKPMNASEIAGLFDVKASTLDSNANIFKLIDAVRLVERFHGIK